MSGSVLQKIRRVIFFRVAHRNLFNFVPDRTYLHLLFLLRFGTFGDFVHPVTYNEKLQWLKLNFRIEDDWKYADKFEVKEIVAELIGQEYVQQTFGVWDTFDEIDFSHLPSSFVLKTTHDSGGVVVVRNRNGIDLDEAKRLLTSSLRRDYFSPYRENHYRSVRRRIMAEEFIVDNSHNELIDYKFYCFNGKVKAIYTTQGRAEGRLKVNHFDDDFNFLDFRYPDTYPNSDSPPKRPARFKEMIHVAEKLSAGHPHVRVDLYDTSFGVRFGELTFFPWGGFGRFSIRSWDGVFGSWLDLPKG